MASDSIKVNDKVDDLMDQSPYFPSVKDYTDKLLEMNNQFKMSKKELLKLDRFKSNVKKDKIVDYKVQIPNSFEQVTIYKSEFSPT